MKAYVLEDKYGCRFSCIGIADPFVMGWKGAAYWFDKEPAEVQKYWLSENYGIHVFLIEIDFAWILMELDK